MRRIMTLVPKYLALICFALAALIPFQYMLATAMTPSSYSMPYPPILFPETMYGGNFAEAWNANHFSQYFLNSLIIAAVATVVIMLVSSAGAYAFARMKFPGRDVLFYLYLFSMMVPTVTNLIPQFLLMKDMKLVDSYLGLLLIYIGIGVPQNTFFLRNFFLGLPKELEEAVIIDGRKPLADLLENGSAAVQAGTWHLCHSGLFQCLGRISDRPDHDQDTGKADAAHCAAPVPGAESQQLGADFRGVADCCSPDFADLYCHAEKLIHGGAHGWNAERVSYADFTLRNRASCRLSMAACAGQGLPSPPGAPGKRCNRLRFCTATPSGFPVRRNSLYWREVRCSLLCAALGNSIILFRFPCRPTSCAIILC